MSIATLIRREGAPIAFAFIFTFGSSVGQTFFISLHTPGIMASLHMSPSTIAAFYGVATIASALALPFLGRLVDRLDLAHFGIGVSAVLTVGCLILAAAISPWMVLGGFFLLRLFGQGLMSHVALTGIARYFDRERGKALSLGGLGHSVGEGVLPLAAVGLIAFLGWRGAYVASGLAVGVVLAPLAFILIRKNVRFRTPFQVAHVAPADAKWSGGLARQPAFWLHLPVLMMSPFAVTALVFHQGVFAAGKDLPLAVFAAAFVGFALVQAPVSLVLGPTIDRFGSRGILLVHLLPLALGAGVLATGAGALSVWIYLALAGITNAAGALLRSTYVAELAPPARLGAAKSFVTSLMVLATAFGPALFGALLDAGLNQNDLAWLTAGLCAAAAAPPSISAIADAFRRRRHARVDRNAHLG
ncbi:MAG: MFS transporter [Terricaulis sp.]